MMSPLEIKILLHHYSRCDPYDGGERQESIKDILDNFEKLGLIDRKDFPSLTGKGNAYVKMLLSTPLPERTFIDPRTQEILGDEQ